MRDAPLIVLRTSLRELVVNLREVAAETEEILLTLELAPGSGTPTDGPRAPLPRPWLLDPVTYTVHWGKQRCFLGNTILFRVMQVLVRHTGQYVSHERLLILAWKAHRTDSAVRSAVGDLRRRLSASDLRQVADAIDGSNPGHFRLTLARGSGPARSN